MTDAPLLVVASGLQKGAKVPLRRGESQVGSDPNCSVVIVDSTLEGCHLRVAVEDAVRIHCDFPIVLSDGTVISPGDVLDVPSTCHFTAGSTQFELALPAEVAAGPPPDARRWPALWPALSGAVALGSAVVVAAIMMNAGGVPSVSAPAMSIHGDVPQAPGADAAIAFLREQADAAGLGMLRMTAQPDGGITVEGMLPKTQQIDWAAIRQRYDRQFATTHVLVERFDPPDEQPPLRVAAVWSGAGPYVVDEHGNRLRTGASLGGGWSIQSIDGQEIVVRRGARSVALKY